MMMMMYKTSKPKFVDFCFKELLIINYLQENYTITISKTHFLF